MVGQTGKLVAGLGIQHTWYPGALPHPQPLSPWEGGSAPEVGCKVPRAVGHSRCHQISISLNLSLAVSSGCKGKGQGLHTKARQPPRLGDSSPSNSSTLQESQRQEGGPSPILIPTDVIHTIPQHVWLQAGTPSQAVDEGKSTRISPVAGFLSWCTRWSRDLNLGLCDPLRRVRAFSPPGQASLLQNPC